MMTPQPIVESGMTFGPYQEGCCFYIERSEIYQQVQQNSVRMCEFLLLRNNGRQIWAVEAKSSTPRPETQRDFDAFIEEIRQKMVNALSLYMSLHLGRHGVEYYQELSSQYQALELSQVQFRFVLVINGHHDSWLPPLQDAVNRVLRPTIKTWALSEPSVVVINDDGARTYRLILDGYTAQ